MLMRWLIRSVATAAGFAALLGVGFLLKAYGLKDPKRERFREGVLASAAIREELGRECILTVDPAPGYEDQVVVTVKYLDPPGDALQRRDLLRNTNMTVRRHVHHVRDLKILFAGEPDLPAWDGGVAMPGTPEPTAYATPVPIPGVPDPPKIAAVPLPSGKPEAGAKPPPPRPTKTGTVTLVTFPDADVFRGNTKVGRTPLFNVELPVGTHLLTLVGADGARHSLSMPVKAGKNAPLKMNLADLPAR